MKPVAVVSAGPVTAAAVILPADFKNTILNDSKQLSEKQREITSYYRTTSHHLCGDSSRALEIDSINILNASIKAMQECVLKHPQPEYIIVDGNSPFIRKRV
jgi:ribonuclease HII